MKYVILVFFLVYLFIGINKLTCMEISTFGCRNNLTKKEAFFFVFLWPWKDES